MRSGRIALRRGGWAASALRRRCPTSSAGPSTSTCGVRWPTRCGGGENAPSARRRGRPRRAPGARGLRRLRAEDLTSAATVLLLDMSRSMLLRGCFLAAKKVAVALDTLIRTRSRSDELHVVGFAYYAREIPPGTLASALLARLRIRHQPAARAAAGAPPAGPRPRRQPRDRGHHRRRADGPLRGRPGASSAIRPRGAPSRRRWPRSAAAPARASPSIPSCSSVRGRWPSSWRA